MRPRAVARSITWLWLTWLVAGCSNTHERGTPPRWRDTSVDGGSEIGSGGPSAQRAGAHTLTRETDASGAAIADAGEGASRQPAIEVWIGQIHNAYVQRFSSRPAAPTDVAVVIRLQTNQQNEVVSGSVAFGSASDAPTPDELDHLGLYANENASRAYDGLVLGFEHGMVAVRRSQSELAFLLSAAQLTRWWCCSSDGSYTCRGAEPSDAGRPADIARICTGPLPPSHSFQLRIDGDHMEGRMDGDATYEPVNVLKLRRRY